MAPRSLRILMLNTEHGWRGGELQLMLLLRGLGSDVTTQTICQPGSPLAQALTASGCPSLPLPMRGPLHLSAVGAIRRTLRNGAFDLVHAHTSHGHSLAALAGIGLGVPLVVTRRVDFPLKRGWFSHWKYVTAVRHYAAVSHAVARVLVHGGVGETGVTVIHDGIDAERFPGTPSTLRAEFSLPAGAIAIGITAQLTDHKDHRTLLDAFAIIERARNDCWLFIVGQGELDAQLKAQTATLGLRHVVFTGFRTDIANILAGLDIFTLCSHLEGLGSSVMDAMHCGLPVVATRAGGIPELIADGVDGLLVGVREPAALAGALQRLAADPALRARLGAQARETARLRFGSATMVAAYQDLYRRLAL
jgi:glycosyltransferase involved in cell wall biosynthesis